MKKLLFILPILFLFLFAGKAYATITWSYSGTPMLPYDGNWHVPGSTGNIFIESPTASQAHDFNSVFGSTPGHLKSLTVTVFKYYAGTCSFNVTAYNANSSAYTTSDTKSYTKGADGWGVETAGQTITLNFDSTFNVGEVGYFHFGNVSNSCVTDNMFNLLSVSLGSVNSNWSGYNYNQGLTIDPVMIVESDIAETSRSITWGSDFAQGFVSTDFKFWNACVNIPPQVGNTDTGVFLYADYNTFGGDNEDQISDDSGYIVPMDPAVGYHGCIIFNKSTDLVPGRYQAAIKLYTGTGDDPQYFGYKVSTDALYFRIIAGSGADLPNNTVANDLGFPENPVVAPQCPQTSFRIFSVDFGKGLCSAFSFLFVPSNDFWTTNNEQTHAILFEQAPFAYFEAIEGNINSGLSTTGNPETTLAITTPIGDFNMDLFNTSDPLMEIYHDSPIRGWLETFLWIGFATYLFFRAFRFFRPV